MLGTTVFYCVTLYHTQGMSIGHPFGCNIGESRCMGRLCCVDVRRSQGGREASMRHRMDRSSIHYSFTVLKK